MGLLDASELVCSSSIDGGGDSLARLDSLEHLGSDAGSPVLDKATLEGQSLAGGIRDEEILSGMFTEDSVAPEDGDGLAGSVGDGNLGNMASGTSDLNGEGASSHSCASQSGDGEDVRDHIEAGLIVNSAMSFSRASCD